MVRVPTASMVLHLKVVSEKPDDNWLYIVTVPTASLKTA
jgi:hypothetical protein